MSVQPDPKEQAAVTSGDKGQPGAQAQEAFAIPEKFKGKSVEDVVKSYTELEKQYTAASQKASLVDKYASIGDPEQINEALSWARNVASEIKSGKLTYAQQQKVAKEAAQAGVSLDGSTGEEIFEHWDELAPREQARVMLNYNKQLLDSEVSSRTETITKQLNEFMQGQERQRQIWMDALEAKLNNPSLDLKELLTNAASIASANPQQLLQMALKNITSSSDVDRKAKELAAQMVAEQKIKNDNDRMAILNSGRVTPKSNPMKTREDETRYILDQLDKKGLTNLVPLS